MSASAKPPLNPWRGERGLQFGQVQIALRASHDDLARIFEVTDTGSLDQLIDTMATLNPAVLRHVFDIMVIADSEAERDALWETVPGISGLVKLHAAMLRTISGQTPDEEAEAEKKRETAEAKAKADTRAEMADLLRDILPTMLTTLAQMAPRPEPAIEPPLRSTKQSKTTG